MALLSAHAAIVRVDDARNGASPTAHSPGRLSTSAAPFGNASVFRRLKIPKSPRRPRGVDPSALRNPWALSSMSTARCARHHCQSGSIGCGKPK